MKDYREDLDPASDWKNRANGGEPLAKMPWTCDRCFLEVDLVSTDDENSERRNDHLKESRDEYVKPKASIYSGVCLYFRLEWSGSNGPNRIDRDVK